MEKRDVLLAVAIQSSISTDLRTSRGRAARSGSSSWIAGLLGLAGLTGLSFPVYAAAEPDVGDKPGRTETQLEARAPVWAGEPGEGFHADAQSFGFSLGGNFGIARHSDHESHHLALAAFSYGQMLGPVLGEERWYKGNLELRGELFAGGEFAPEEEWFVGLTPVLRYHFAIGGRAVPFLEAGLGVTATSIGAPDLGGTFQFNERAGLGCHWFMKDHLAWTAEAFYIHWSNGGIREPNSGLNGVTGLIGLTLFF